MSAGILRALVQLFAIIAGGNRSTGREIVAVFLRQQLNKEMVNLYLAMFDEYAEKHHSSAKQGKEYTEKRTSLNSVKVLRICDRINEELAQKEKLFVLLRLLEFVHAFSGQHQQESEFVDIVAEAFNIEPSDIQNLQTFIRTTEDNLPAHPDFLIASGTEETVTGVSLIHCEGLRSKLICLRIENENLFFIRLLGKDELLLNGQSIAVNRAYVLSPGSSIKGPRTSTLFYSDILHKFIQTFGDIKIVFRAENISYLWPHNKKQAIHQLNIIEESGSIIGIMGGSGAGKSTLLNILNGNCAPTYGKVTINGYDIHRERDKIEGVLGYVSQDDLLVEELTVFQNLYFNAQLCFASKTGEEISQLVVDTLKSIGLYEAKDLRVGSIMDKTISGGQRKRLNIALELIREPSVLFVDEPTSGLSSRDSENIMDLLKELTLRGKLVFVVIHQPSSEIFKMFDKLFIVDQGGFPIYYGNPVESIVHFKRLVNHVNHNESECPHCGNVNPEQIFNIIEAKVVDEYGNLTEHRKITPREWNNFFNVIIGNHITVKDKILDTPKSAFSLPSRFRQFLVYAWRDVRTKLANRQYMIINFMEAPVLAFVLSLFIKFYPTSTDGRQDYSFSENLNFPQYLFISVMVSLFLGLTVSAEEIIRDQKMLKREKYLHLSRRSYLFAKTAIVFLISAIQTFSFVLIGNAILEVQDMTLAFWLVLFSTSCFANVLGLNISATFNSAKVIYILIPILIIPQLLFSGLIVRFDRLHPSIASQSGVPLVGNIMASRWAYEALAVYQFRNSAFNRYFFETDQVLKSSNWKKDFWYPELKTKAIDYRQAAASGTISEKNNHDLDIIRNEMAAEIKSLRGFTFDNIDKLQPGVADTALMDEVVAELDYLANHYRNQYNQANNRRQAISDSLTRTPAMKAAYLKLQEAHHNTSLEEFLINKNDMKKIVEYRNRLVQKYNQIYLVPGGKTFFGAHFYSPSKPMLGGQITTISANVMVLWGMTLLLLLLLMFDGMRKFVDGISNGLLKIGMRVRLTDPDLPEPSLSRK